MRHALIQPAGITLARRPALLTREISPIRAARPDAWWRADSGIGVADGANVPTWLDRSGNGHTLSQGTVSDMPNFVANDAAINNRPAVDLFSDDYLNADTLGPSFAGDVAVYTSFTVYTHRVDDQQESLWSAGMSDSFNGYVWAFNRNTDLSSNSRKADDATTITRDTPSGAGIGPFIRVDIQKATPTVSIHIGGSTLELLDSANDVGQITPDQFSMGTLRRSGGGTVSFWDGLIAEQIFYFRVLSSAEINRIGQFLSAWYSLTWADVL